MNRLYYNDSHAYDPTAGKAMSRVSRNRRRKALKKRLRDMTWDDYGISKYRYQELKAFCLQYPEKKDKIRYGLASHENTSGSGGIGRPTETQALLNARYIKDCEMVEQAAIAAAPDIYPYILKSVTEGLSYEELEFHPELGRVPVCKKDFYGIRRRFYAILHQKKR